MKNRSRNDNKENETVGLLYKLGDALSTIIYLCGILSFITSIFLSIYFSKLYYFFIGILFTSLTILSGITIKVLFRFCSELLESNEETRLFTEETLKYTRQCAELLRDLVLKQRKAEIESELSRER